MDQKRRTKGSDLVLEWIRDALRISGIKVERIPQSEFVTWEISRLPPGGLITAWVGDMADEAQQAPET